MTPASIQNEAEDRSRCLMNWAEEMETEKAGGGDAAPAPTAYDLARIEHKIRNYSGETFRHVYACLPPSLQLERIDKMNDKEAQEIIIALRNVSSRAAAYLRDDCSENADMAAGDTDAEAGK